MQGGYIIIDGDRVVDCNAVAERILDALLGEATDDGAVGTPKARVFEATGLADGPGEFTATIDGEHRHVEARSMPLEDDGAVIGDLVVFTDVTDRVRAREELARERAEFDALFQGLADPVAKTRIDDDGRPIVRRVNRAFEETFGYTEDQLRGENLDDYIVPPDRDRKAEYITREAADGALIRQDVVREGTDDRREFILRTAAAGDATVYAFYTDVTERRRRERELERKNERLEEFASVVSHDLRNHVDVATSHVTLAREDEDPTERLDELEATLGRIEAVIEDVLTLARQGDEVTDPETASLADLAREAWGGLDPGGATLAVEDLELRADPDRLLRLFENLFHNSLAHVGEDVAVTVGPLDGDGDDRGRGFYVADDGPGIDPDRHEDVFEHGYTTAEDGTGFGLAIVRRIARAHGWSVGVAESESGGARFEFRFDDAGGTDAGADAVVPGEDTGP